ncbi:MAG TPA: hypothetical protein VK120_06460 [Sporosarcina sp.]|nr:hypothetical protein [Sporosarcina sp.]
MNAVILVACSSNEDEDAKVFPFQKWLFQTLFFSYEKHEENLTKEALTFNLKDYLDRAKDLLIAIEFH